MSFSVRNAASGLEYNATSLDTLFCQRRNLLSPRFWGMMRDLLRFYREAPALLTTPGPGPTVGRILPREAMALLSATSICCRWRRRSGRLRRAAYSQFPAQYLVRFMANHQMLQISGRSPWRVVSGGSATYVSALRTRWRLDERLNCPVRSVRRGPASVQVISAAGTEYFDQVVLACHSDQSLRLLADASDRERDILGAIPYQDNETILHTDASLLPLRRKAWAAWNAFVPANPGEVCTVSYCMNLLQGLTSRAPLVVTLNRTSAIDPAKVLRRMRYRHPVYTQGSVAAQSRRAEIQGLRRTWFAGAYWGWGFHEDGIRSAVDVCTALTSEVPLLGVAA